MKLFGSSGLSQGQKRAKASQKPTSDVNPHLKDVIRNAVKANSGRYRGQHTNSSQNEADTSLDNAPIRPFQMSNVAKTLTRPNLPPRPLSMTTIGRAIANSASFGVRWSPFMVAMFLTFVVLKNVTNDFEAFLIAGTPETAKDDGITPTEPPIIYEKGIEPFANIDDRVPISALSREYDLHDPMLVDKLTGIGAIYSSTGRCTASLIGRRDFLVTASHCLSKSAAKKNPIRFYSVVCSAFYEGTTKYIRTFNARKNTDLDYAFIKLDAPACKDAEPFQAVTFTDEAAKQMRTRHYPLLSLSVFPFADIRRHSEFPEAKEQATFRYGTLTTFGVFGRFAKQRDNTAEQDATLTYYLEGGDPFNGASGGPLLASLDGGKSYQIIGVLYGHETYSKLSIYPRVKGDFAKQLEEYFALWDDGARHD